MLTHLLSLLSYRTQDHLVKYGTAPSGRGIPISIIKQGPKDLPTGNLINFLN